MDAYTVLVGIGTTIPIEESDFNSLRNEFQHTYLADKNYFERFARHRRPIEVKIETLSEIYSYLLKIQNREEMRDIDTEKNFSGHVPTKVMEIWKSDKSLKSCYNSIKEYCVLRTKNFNTIAVHIAEYRAVSKLASKLERSKQPPSNNGISLNTSSHMNQLQISVETFQNMLVDIATGSKGDELGYKKLREELLNTASLKGLTPDFVQTNRTAAQFWQFIKSKYSSYAERRDYIWTEFSKIFNFLDGKNKGVADESITSKIDKFSQQYIKEEWSKALSRKNDDPEGAITTSRTLIETTCKYILHDSKVDFKDDLELPRLYKLTAEQLNLAPDQHTEQIFRQILGGCQTVVDGLGALRNKLSDSHGKKVNQVKPSTRHAELAVNLSGALTTFLLETYEFKKGKNQ